MPDEPEVTGPPIDTPEGHVHEETPPDEVLDAIEDESEDIDELAEQLAVHQIISEERHDEILERVDECRNQLEALSTTGTAESPLLTQMLNQLIEIRTELATLKSSMDSKLRNRELNASPEAEATEVPENVEVDHPEAEIEPPPAKRKARFV